MASKTNKVFQLIRDIFLLLFSIIIMSTSKGVFRGEQEPVHYVLFFIAALLALLTLINILLLIIRVQNRFYFYFNAIIQIPISFIIAGLNPSIFGFISLGLILLNIIIIITLRKKEEK